MSRRRRADPVVQLGNQLADARRRAELAERAAAEARDRLHAHELAIAKFETDKSTLDKHKASIRELEDLLAGERVRIVELEAEVKDARAHPVFVTVPRQREHLPNERRSVTWELRVGDRKQGGLACWVHVGLYADGRVGEFFLRWHGVKRRHGQEAAWADAACTYASIALQYGAPLKDNDDTGESGVISKLVYQIDTSGGATYVRLDPDDDKYVRDPQVPKCSSLRDYLGRKLAMNTDRDGRWIGLDPAGGHNPPKVRVEEKKGG